MRTDYRPGRMSRSLGRLSSVAHLYRLLTELQIARRGDHTVAYIRGLEALIDQAAHLVRDRVITHSIKLSD